MDSCDCNFDHTAVAVVVGVEEGFDSAVVEGMIVEEEMAYTKPSSCSFTYFFYHSIKNRDKTE